MSVHQTKDGRWFVKSRDKNGKEKREYFGRGDMAKSQANSRDEEVKRTRGKLKLEASLTIEEVCQLYHTQHPVQESTASSDYYRMSRVIVPAIGHIQVEALSTDRINQYILERIKEGRKRRTVDRELDVLKSAFSWAQRQDPPLIMRNPLLNFRFKADDSEILSPPTSEEIAKIIKYAAPHLKRAIIMEWHTGVRPGGELSRICWYDVDFSSMKIRVQSARKGGPVIRYVPIQSSSDGPFVDYLLWWKQQDEIELTERFPDEEQRPDVGTIPVVHLRLKSVVSLKRSWAYAKRKARITRRIRPYDLRHAFATYLLEAGADLKSTSELMGHSRPDTTLRTYQHTIDKQHREAVAKIPQIPGHHFWSPKVVTKPAKK